MSDHAHDHALPAGPGHRRTLANVLSISGVILVVEVVGAFISGSLALLADAELAQVRTHLLEVAHVQGVHDLHASTVATDLPTLSAHIVVDDSCFHDGHVQQLLDEVQACLVGHFDVEHSTFQFEPSSHAAHEHSTHA